MKTTPKDFFLNLLSVGTIYASIVWFLVLLFQYINYQFPDQLRLDGSFYYSPIFDLIRTAISVLLVVFPVHVLVSWFLGRDLRREPEKRSLWVRRWLLYFTLFASAVTMIITLVLLVHGFLGGDLTERFVFKVLSVLVVSAAVFGYFLWDVRREPTADSRAPRTWAWIVSAVLLLTIIGGFFIMGTPGEQRKRRFDEQRVSNLQLIQSFVDGYYFDHQNVLPAHLDDVKAISGNPIAPVDPQTGAIYEYRVIGNRTYELCAVFSGPFEYASVKRYPREQNWNHGAGKTCFQLSVPTSRPPSID